MASVIICGYAEEEGAVKTGTIAAGAYLYLSPTHDIDIDKCRVLPSTDLTGCAPQIHHPLPLPLLIPADPT